MARDVPIIATALLTTSYLFDIFLLNQMMQDAVDARQSHTGSHALDRLVDLQCRRMIFPSPYDIEHRLCITIEFFFHI